jgi:hypothetical protein
MAVNNVNAVIAPVVGYSQGHVQATVLQAPSGPTGDSTFIIDLRPTKSHSRRSLRGATITILNNGTAFTTATFNTSLDGVNYETLKLFDNAASGLQIAATPVLTSGNLSFFVLGHDANFLKIVTTVGDATSGYTVTVGA